MRLVHVRGRLPSYPQLTVEEYQMGRVLNMIGLFLFWRRNVLVLMAFLKARVAGEEFAPITRPGIAYMLDGGGGPSISDPFMTEPVDGDEWIKDTPPHLMVLSPGDLSNYPTKPGPEPWSMFPDTSFAHLMVTVPVAAE